MYTTYTRIVGNPHFVAAKTPPLLEIASPSSSLAKASRRPCWTLRHSAGLAIGLGGAPLGNRDFSYRKNCDLTDLAKKKYYIYI